MRFRLAAAACLALALFTAAPAALAGTNHVQKEEQGERGRVEASERLLRVADRFDRRSGALRKRSAWLRTTALELRGEAEELAAAAAGDGQDPLTDPLDEAAAGRIGDEHEDDSGFEEEPCGGDGSYSKGSAREGDHVDDSGGDAAGDAEGTDEEVCKLLRRADRLEDRADALDAAARRMAWHATKLRAKAAKLLGSVGEADARRLLAKAQRLRNQADRLRAHADRRRDEAFTGTDVDEDAVRAVERLELHAARNDVAADRLEARAARLAAAAS